MEEVAGSLATFALIWVVGALIAANWIGSAINREAQRMKSSGYPDDVVRLSVTSQRENMPICSALWPITLIYVAALHLALLWD